jgi:hypothetical protein
MLKQNMHMLASKINDWYVKANKMCEQNYINLFNPSWKAWKWEDVWK